jgi:hypothetical protein
MELGTGSVENNNGDVEFAHGLLEAKVAVAGNEHIKLLLRQGQ